MDSTTKYPLLDTIQYPSDIKRLTITQLQQLCDELRSFIIEQLSNHPGHFASSLGTVELTVALHYVYDTPEDRIVWDVGHQAYGHKILTGRKDVFHTNRQFGGLSGFPNPDESEYDAFVAGHASNSISAALGMAVAAQLNHSSKHAVAVIGDGSMTGGLAYEALNNANSQKNNILIILNDNDMAIDKNVGGLRDYLVTMTTSNLYNRLRFCVYNLFKKGHIMSESRKNYVLRFNNSLKALLTKQHNLFEGFNIRYFGPVDGHDLKQLIRVLQNIKDLNGPKILHLHTVKGKGFKPAELSATEWHAPGKFDICTGQRIKTPSKDQRQLYQDVFGHTLVELAKADHRIMGVTPAMPTGCSMTYMMKEFPDRSFDVGIAEAHAVTYSAGLAKEGFVPFCNIYSSFMQRAYDQVIHDVAIQRLHVVLCLDRAGLVGEDGATHHGAFDLSYMRCIPNLIIASPFNEHCLRNLMFTAVYGQNGPFVIRYPKGKGELPDWRNEMKILPIGKGRIVKEGEDMAVLSLGNIGNTALAAIKQIEAKYPNVSIALYDLIFLKPLDEELLDQIAAKFKKLITIENGVLSGGMGSAVLEYFSDHNYKDISVSRIGLPDEFVTHGSLNDLKKHCRLDVEGITERFEKELESLPK